MKASPKQAPVEAGVGAAYSGAAHFREGRLYRSIDSLGFGWLWVQKGLIHLANPFSKGKELNKLMLSPWVLPMEHSGFYFSRATQKFINKEELVIFAKDQI